MTFTLLAGNRCHTASLDTMASSDQSRKHRGGNIHTDVVFQSQSILCPPARGRCDFIVDVQSEPT